MKFILAVDVTTVNGKNNPKYGIGKDGKLAWGIDIKEDLAFFKEKTIGKNIVIGNNTFKELPYLKNRYIMVFSNEKKDKNYYNLKQLEDAIIKMETKVENGKDSVIVCGGKQTYEKIIQNEKLKPYVTGGYITKIFFKKEPYLSNQYDVEISNFIKYIEENMKVNKENSFTLLDNDIMTVIVEEYEKL